MDIHRSLASPLEKNSLAHYELAYSRRSGQWTVDSGQWTVARNGERRKTNVEESKRERVGGPFALSPSPRPFAIFSSPLFFAFSQLSEGLLQVTYVLHLQMLMVYNVFIRLTALGAY